jgi:mRNA interferase MazF
MTTAKFETISNNDYQANYSDAVVLALTSNLSISDYKVSLETQDLETGTLPVQSAVRIDKPFSVLSDEAIDRDSIYREREDSQL